MNAKDRTVIGVAVYRARVAKGWGKEKAANTAGVSSITWKRVEDGLAVQDAKLGLILGAVGLTDAALDSAGEDVAVHDSFDATIAAAERVAAAYLERGGDPERALELIQAATERAALGRTSRPSTQEWYQILRNTPEANAL